MLSNRMSVRSSLDANLLDDDEFTRPNDAGDTMTGINQTSPTNSVENNIVIPSVPE